MWMPLIWLTGICQSLKSGALDVFLKLANLQLAG